MDTTTASKRVLCIACLEPHTTTLVLCPRCEALAQAIRTRHGLPLRGVAP